MGKTVYLTDEEIELINKLADYWANGVGGDDETYSKIDKLTWKIYKPKKK